MNRKSMFAALLGLLLLSGISTRANAGDHDHMGHAKHEGMTEHDDKMTAQAEHAADDAAIVAAQLPTYPLDRCPISGEKLGEMGKPMDIVHQGRLVRLCCGNCQADFLADPAAAFAKIDAAVIEQQLPDYPLESCPVSGEKLGEMGEPYNHVSGTRLVRFCCGGCVEEFEENPARFLAKIDAAAGKAEEAPSPEKVHNE